MTSKNTNNQFKFVSEDRNEISDGKNDGKAAGEQDHFKTELGKIEANDPVTQRSETHKEAQLIAEHEDDTIKDHHVDSIKEQPGDPDADRTTAMEENVASGLDGGWGWFIVAGSFLIHFIQGGFHRSHGLMYLQLLERYKMSATATSWVLALSLTVNSCMGPVVSVLCNRFSIRFVVFLGSILSLIGFLISGFSPNLWFLYFGFGVVDGMGRAMVYCPCLIIVGYYFNKRRGLAVGLATSGGGAGSIFPPMVEKLFDFYGFTGTFLILSALACHSMISGSLFRSLEFQKGLHR